MKKEKDTLLWFVATIVSVLFAMTSVIVIRAMGMGGYYLVSDSNAPFALLVSYCAFMLFKSIKLPNSQRINAIAASTFGIFLIHTQGDSMRKWLWTDTLHNVDMYGSHYLYFHALVSIIGVFSVCALLDWTRRVTIEKSLMNVTDYFIGRIRQKQAKVCNPSSQIL